MELAGTSSLLADLFGSRLIVVLVHFTTLPLQIAWMGFIQEFFYEPPPSNVMSESVVLRLSQASGLLN